MSMELGEKVIKDKVLKRKAKIKNNYFWGNSNATIFFQIENINVLINGELYPCFRNEKR